MFALAPVEAINGTGKMTEANQTQPLCNLAQHFCKMDVVWLKSLSLLWGELGSGLVNYGLIVLGLLSCCSSIS